MSTDIQYLNRVHRFDSGLTPTRDALTLGISLSVGLTILVPILSLFTPLPTLIWVGIIGIVYGSTALLIGRPTLGAYAGLLVTITFAANVPLASNSYLRSMTRDLGPSVWLAHLPLVTLLALLFVRDRESFFEVSQAEGLLGAFVGWVVLTALISNPIRLDTALYFALFVLQGVLVFAGVRRTHKQLPIAPRTTLHILLATILLKTLFGLAEAINGESFGLTQLGELSPRLAVRIAEITVDPFVIPVGTFVSGFSGMSFILASLIVLIVPYALYLVLYSSWRSTAISSLSIILMLFTLRLTGTDAGRGAVLVAVGLLLTLIIFKQVQGLSNINKRKLGVFMVLALVGVGLVLVPSTQSGVTSELPESVTTSGEPQSGTDPGGDVSISDVSIPLFDVSNLGIRIQQYVVGTQLFIDNPMFGISGANFEYTSDQYGLADNLPIHNIYIGLLVETGIIGAFLYSLFLATIITKGIRSVYNEQTLDITAAAVAGLVGYLGFMFWDYMLFDSVVSSFVFYTICAVVAANDEFDDE